jgi:hypothetical protein
MGATSQRRCVKAVPRECERYSAWQMGIGSKLSESR